MKFSRFSSNQLSNLITRLLGTPTAETWPGVKDLPDYKPIFPQWKGQELAQKFKGKKNMEPEGIVVLKELLVLDPVHRISAKRALKMPYFDALVREA